MINLTSFYLIIYILAFQHQNLGPPAGFEVQPAALRPGINVQTRTQGLFLSS